MIPLYSLDTAEDPLPVDDDAPGALLDIDAGADTDPVDVEDGTVAVTLLAADLEERVENWLDVE